MKAVENFPDKSLYDFVTFKLRPPSDNLGINLCQLQLFRSYSKTPLNIRSMCAVGPIPSWKRCDLDQKGQNFQGLLKYFWE